MQFGSLLLSLSQEFLVLLVLLFEQKIVLFESLETLVQVQNLVPDTVSLDLELFLEILFFPQLNS